MAVVDAAQYRKQAEDARKNAAGSLNAEGKAIWLRMADEFERLAQEADKTSTQNEGQSPPQSD